MAQWIPWEGVDVLPSPADTWVDVYIPSDGEWIQPTIDVCNHHADAATFSLRRHDGNISPTTVHTYYDAEPIAGKSNPAGRPHTYVVHNGKQIGPGQKLQAKSSNGQVSFGVSGMKYLA